MNGMKCIGLENEYVYLNLIADYGAKLSHLVYKPRNVDLIWHNPRVDYRRPTFGLPVHFYDGAGWDEVLPTDLACSWRGEDYPYYGEVWALPWRYEIEREQSQEACVHLWVTCALSQLRMDKWIRVRKDDRGFEVKHRITNISNYDAEYFFWMSHATLPCVESSRIDIPARRLQVEEAKRPCRFRAGSYAWPLVNDKDCTVDVREIGRRDGTCDWFFAMDLEDGWVAVSNVSKGVGMAFVFPKEVFPTVGFFINRGGDRGHYSVAVEPSTGYPIRLTDAIENGTARELKPGDSFESMMQVRIYQDLSSVSRVGPDGTIE